MKGATFTVRDLNRQPAKVLDTCDRLGTVEIRSRSGKVYFLKLAVEEKKDFVGFAARRKAAGMKRLTKRESDSLDRLIAGE